MIHERESGVAERRADARPTGSEWIVRMPCRAIGEIHAIPLGPVHFSQEPP